MHTLIVAATHLEAQYIISNLAFEKKAVDPTIYKTRIPNNNVDILICGVGIVPTVFNLGKILAQTKYDLIINIGICGTFRPDIPIGSNVLIVKDQFADWGIVNQNNEFIPIHKTNLLGENEQLFHSDGCIKTIPSNYYPNDLQKVKGITVNSVTGTTSRVSELIKIFNCDIESMEGAAAFYVANKYVTPIVQIRGISNIVENRDPSKWKIDAAIKSYSDYVIQYLHNIGL